jgi:hypothetical protein
MPGRFPGAGRPGKGGGGRAGAVMAGLAVRESVTVAGRPERAQVARAFVGSVLGPGHPRGDDAAPLVNELFGKSVRHSRSGTPGETVTVTVRASFRDPTSRCLTGGCRLVRSAREEYCAWCGKRRPQDNQWHDARLVLKLP